MKGEMYLSHPFHGAEEYIVVEEVGSIVALMRCHDQSITWVTKNTLKFKWKKKEAKHEAESKNSNR